MSKNKSYGYVFMNGILNENPTFRLLLGMCPTLAVSTAVSQGLGMGLSTAFVMVFSSLVISLLRNVITDKIRIPAFVVIIATFVTIVDMLLKAYLPSLSASLGVYIPLIVVNCIIFARAEAFAFKNTPVKSMVDALGSGLGFTLGITLLSVVRELFGHGTLLGYQIMPDSYAPMSIVTRPPGGFITLGILVLIVNAVVKGVEKMKANKAKGEIA